MPFITRVRLCVERSCSGRGVIIRQVVEQGKDR